MRQIALIVAYDGTDFHGWQRQPSLRTVQGELEKVLSHVLNHPVSLRAAGRTDAGVHAEGQVAATMTDSPLPADQLPRAVGPLLPQDILVKEAFEVPLSFHPRRDARSRVYCYLVDISPQQSVVSHRFAAYCPNPLNLDRMEHATHLLTGYHDFRGFMGQGSRVGTTFRKVYQIQLFQKGRFLGITLEADSFLHQMARRIATALLRVGSQSLEPETLYQALKTGDTRVGEPPAPAKGLWLQEVRYHNPGAPLLPLPFLQGMDEPVSSVNSLTIKEGDQNE
ncbi:MAG: tRNA pseudouridine(38-40) synthase TruA [Armatimonadetes bacterium]|nr:tRNA pseudouridine(38-40) synthase TruA [Armatimonadota bacterium]MDW8121189.1 tRNA pseudouridine(38-40) synthase TruA [Armatimonadota bacterium]